MRIVPKGKVGVVHSRSYGTLEKMGQVMSMMSPPYRIVSLHGSDVPCIHV